MKRYSLVMSALICYILGILLGGIILTGESVFAFGFGISDSDSEEETIVARKDINIGGAPQDQEEGLVDNVVKSFINWTLGILGMVALIMVLYGGFMMLTARDNADAYTKGWTILKNALIGLVIIGVAWFIISLIFWLIVQTGDGVGTADSAN